MCFYYSMEVVQTFDRTSLSDRAAYRIWAFGNPAKIQDRTQKYHVPALQNMPSVTVEKNISTVLP